MIIEKICIKNYRLLRNTIINCENDLSLIVGKNNCGKTSLMSVLNKCIGEKSEIGNFEYYDLSICFQKKLYQIVNGDIIFNENELNGIQVDVYISYDDTDNLSNLSQLLLDLDPDNKTVVIRFEYSIDAQSVNLLKDDYFQYMGKHPMHQRKSKGSKDNTNSIIIQFSKFMQKRHRKYFLFKRYSVLFDHTKQEVDEKIFKILDKKDFDISKIISFNFIDAKHDVSNTSDNDLSILSNAYYKEKKSQNEDAAAISEFENQIDKTDTKFDTIYKKVFKELIDKISKFGGMKKDDTNIKIISQMQSSKLLKDNTTVVYNDESNYLPEHYNGLGYLNLISMIIKIETVLSEIRKDNKTDESPADINLIFIEEP